MSLENIFHPESVAVIGASREEGRIGYEVLSNLREYFPEKKFPVNPNADRIEGMNCFDSIRDVPEEVDLAVVVVPAKMVRRVLAECFEAGVSDVVVISAGFKEVGEEGRKLEEEITELAKREEVNLVGPNSLGVISTESGLNASFADQMALEGNVSFMSQSGAFCTAVLDWANEVGLGFNGFVSLGNKAVIDEVDLMKAWDEDQNTEVILGYLEGVTNGREFIRVARDVTQRTPVVVVKSGSSEEGSRAVSSHTGTMAGSDVAYEAALDQAGVIRAGNVEEVFDFATILSRQEAVEGNKVGIMTNSGGPGVMATDALEEYGMELAELSEKTLEGLDEILSPLADRQNPVDMTGDADEEDYREALNLVMEDPAVDCLVAISAPAAIVSYKKLAGIIADAREEYEKPVASCLMGAGLEDEAREKLEKAGVVNFFDPARAVRSLSALFRYGKIKKREQKEPEKLGVDYSGAEKLLKRAGNSDTENLGLESIGILEKYGVPVAETRLVTSIEEAEGSLDGLKGPLVAKVASGEISHKSDVGGVEAGISLEEVPSAYSEMVEKFSRREGVSNLRGVRFQEMVEGQEVIVGFDRDPQFGPLLMFGLGGIYVEVLEDVSFRVAPVSRREALQMIKSVKSFPILAGARGFPEVDVKKLAEVIRRISQLAVDFPRIKEMDVNPLICSGSELKAVDFRARIGRKSGSGEEKSREEKR